MAAFIESGVLEDSTLPNDFSKSRVEAAVVLGGFTITEDFKSSESGVEGIIALAQESRGGGRQQERRHKKGVGAS